MKDYEKAIINATPYLQVARSMSRGTLKALLMQADREIIYSIQTVMAIGKTHYFLGDTTPAPDPVNYFEDWRSEVPVFKSINREAEVDYIVNNPDMRRFVSCGMQIMTIL